MQASDRLYYLYQSIADTAEALQSTPEGQAALQHAQQAAQQAAQRQQLQQLPKQQQSPNGSSSSSSKGKGGASAAAVTELSTGDELYQEVLAALSDDLNTPLAVAALSAPLKLMNDLLHTKKVSGAFTHTLHTRGACKS